MNKADGKKRMRSRSFLVTSVLFLIIIAGQAIALTHFEMLDLAELGSLSWAIPCGIDDDGVVVGTADFDGGGDLFGVAWRTNERYLLGPLQGEDSSEAWASNSSLKAVGTSWLIEQIGPLWYFYPTAVMWSPGQLVPLQDLVVSGPDMELDYGIDINEAGQIIGYGRYSGEVGGYGFLLEDGVLTDLGTLGGYSSEANAINEEGIIVGQAWTDGGQNHAFRWEDGLMTDLGTLGGRDSRATGVNDFGQIVGGAQSQTSPELAVLWENGGMITLGTLGGNQSNANSINNQGQIVGFSTDEQYYAHAFFWEEGTMYNLADLIPQDQGWGGRANAYDINNAGQVVGLMYRGDGDHGFVATPVDIEIGEPVPGVAGMVNTLSISHATPGARVRIVFGSDAGLVRIPGGCPGATVLINEPVQAGSVVVNESGEAEFAAFVPPGAAGRTVRIQAVEAGACQVSNVVVHEF